MRIMTLSVLAGLAALAGCGGPEMPAGDNEQGAAAAAKADESASAWNAADACALVDAKIVADATGSEVTGSLLSGASPGGDRLAALSTCTFTLANGASIGVLTRRSATADFSPGAVEAARTGGGMMPAAADLPGLGKAALWTKEMNSLQLFIDDRRYAAINIVRPAAGSDPQKIAIAIGRSLL